MNLLRSRNLLRNNRVGSLFLLNLVGNNVVNALGAIVTKDMLEKVVVKGNPAKVFKQIEI